MTGPHQYQREQTAIRHKFERKRMYDDYTTRRTASEDRAEVQRLIDAETLQEAEMTVRHRREFREMEARHQREIADNGGIDLDEPAYIRRTVVVFERDEISLRGQVLANWETIPVRHAYIQRIENCRNRANQFLERHRERYPFIVQTMTVYITRMQVVLDEFEARRIEEEENRGVAGWGGEQRRGARAMAIAITEEARIARDTQNVHTKRIVDEVKANISLILRIEVEDGWRWKPDVLSQTFKDIVAECALSPKAMWQFASYYCNDAPIYDMGAAIFGHTTDGVWSFIRTSEHKADLVRILKHELEDNIGMCAQGNLSRIANVLMGYLDGIGQMESLNVVLGREMSMIMGNNLATEATKIQLAEQILRRYNVPAEEWSVWLDPLRA